MKIILSLWGPIRMLMHKYIDLEIYTKYYSQVYPIQYRGDRNAT